MPRLFLGPLLLAACCLLLNGCSQVPWVRLFNYSGQSILVEGKSLPPGMSVRVDMSVFEDGESPGFIIPASGKQVVYEIVPEQVALPPAMRTHMFLEGYGYLIEYAEDSKLYALNAADPEHPKRLDPQPKGFPLSPKPVMSVIPSPGEP